VLLSSGDSFPHLIQKPRSQLGFVTYLLNYPRIYCDDKTEGPHNHRYTLMGLTICSNFTGPLALSCQNATDLYSTYLFNYFPNFFVRDYKLLVKFSHELGKDRAVSTKKNNVFILKES
jgi:hypothetical protein